MPRAERLNFIRQIEGHRHSRVLSFFLGDRPNLNTVIADDVVRVIYDHLAAIGRADKIDVFLYTRGGVGVAPARIARLIREHTARMDVLVPYRCHSGGTVLCCGANAIVMHRMGELSPVDSTTTNVFNPIDRQGRNLPIGVEDVRGYLSLAKDSGLKSEAAETEAFKLLSGQVNVIALGNIQRVYKTGVELIPHLLRLHLDGDKDKVRIDRIHTTLSGTYTHDYLIERREARDIGLPVEEPDDTLSGLMWSLYEVYERDLSLRIPFIPELPIDQNASDFRFETAYVETTDRTDAFLQEGTITRSMPQAQPQQVPFAIPGIQPNVPQPPIVPGLPIVRFRRQAWVDVTAGNAEIQPQGQAGEEASR